jgi:hypothetical protein
VRQHPFPVLPSASGVDVHSLWSGMSKLGQSTELRVVHLNLLLLGALTFDFPAFVSLY